MLPEKADCVAAEFMDPGLTASHSLEGICPVASPSHCQQYLELGVQLLHLDDLLIETCSGGL